LVDIAKNMDVDNVYASYLYLYNRFHWQGSTVRSLQIMADYYQLNNYFESPLLEQNNNKLLEHG
jgi:hypothetical protein